MRYDNQIPENGYKSAITYYRKLKEKFLNELSSDFKAQSAREIEKSLKIITNVSNAQWEGEGGKTTANILNLMFQRFAENQDIQKAANSVIAEIQQQNSQVDLQIREQRHAIIQQINSQFLTERGIQGLIKQVIGDVVKSKDIGASKGTLQEIVNRGNTLFRVVLSAKMQGLNEYVLKGWPMRTMQGFLRESGEFNALNKVFKGTSMKVTPGGSKKVSMNIGGKNRKVETVFDNILSTLEFSEEAFNKEVRGTSVEGLNLSQMLSSVMPKIHYFGEQVKSFNLQSKASVGLDHRIASNENLRLKLMSSVKNKNYVTATTALKFMAKTENIVSVFGPATVLFSSGAGRQWMFDFIKDFRKMNYYLQFQYISAGVPSSEIILTHPFVYR